MLTTLAFYLSFLQAPAQDNLVLVREGQARCQIALPAHASPSMKHGAQELRVFLAKISGAEVPVVQGSGGSGAPVRIVLKADPKMNSEEFRIQTSPGRVEISGGALRGVMYGCYCLLEDVLGVRWFNSRVTKIPRATTITLGRLDIHEKPAFEYREPFFTEAFERDWAARNRTNGSHQRLDAEVGGKVAYGVFVHTFNELVPPEKYFDTHPEYFSLIDGQRRKGYYQLCLTNPDVVKISIAKVEEWIKQYPDATIFSVSQNDTYYNCQCPECKAVEAEEGAPSGVLLRFVNQVAEEIEKKHPNVLIDTLAYQWSEKPPLMVRPRKNVRIRIAPIGACFSHPLDGCAENVVPLQNLKNWAKITDQIYIWHYTTNFANYLQPLPNLDEIARDVALFRENGTVGFFDEGGYAGGGCSDLAELKSYLLAKLMWNPNLKAQPIIDEYLQGVYGKAAPYISRWINLTHQAGRAMTAHARIYDPPTAPYLSDAVLQQGNALFDLAEQAVADDVFDLEEVRRTRLALEYVQLMRTPRESPSFAVLAKVVADKIRQYGIEQIREGEPVAAFLKRIGQG